MNRDEAFAMGRKIGAPLGGKASNSRPAPAACPRCGRSYAGKTMAAYKGHLGLHGLADRYFAGDIEAAQRRLRENGRARQDPAPWNGAWKPYRPVAEQEG